uniref:Replication-associated protein G2P n=1 Tax=Dulem virus 60 TaxID=3145771 RepID=A0AAU8B2Z4_9VIRU
MIDTLEIHIPVFPAYCRSTAKDCWEIVGDVTDYGLTGNSRYVKKSDDGDNIAYDLYHAYESIPTSHTGIAFKFMHRAYKTMPFVLLNCSIAKILQGHNVYGNLDMISGACEMLGVFKEKFSEFSAYLDFSRAEVVRFDVTLPALTSSLNMAERIRDFLRNVDYGRYRSLSVRNIKEHYNTLYFGSEQSKTGGFKIYCKGIEFNKEMKELEHKALKNCIVSHALLNKVFTPDVREYAQRSIRIEATIKKRAIKEHGLSVNLWDFLVYQYRNPNIYQKLFNLKTGDFIEALKGMYMSFDDDVKLYELLLARLTTITPTGKKSTTKAQNAYNFYKRIKDDGFYEVKRTTEERTFRRNVKSLIDAGLSRAYLQSLAHSEEKPIIRLLNLDMKAENPPSYVHPVSSYFNEFSGYLQRVA